MCDSNIAETQGWLSVTSSCPEVELPGMAFGVARASAQRRSSESGRPGSKQARPVVRSRKVPLAKAHFDGLASLAYTSARAETAMPMKQASKPAARGYKNPSFDQYRRDSIYPGPCELWRKNTLDSQRFCNAVAASTENKVESS